MYIDDIYEWVIRTESSEPSDDGDDEVTAWVPWEECKTDPTEHIVTYIGLCVVPTRMPTNET